jgi:ribonuclease VapC
MTSAGCRTDVVIDSSALVAIILDEPERVQFSELVLERSCLIGAPTLLETSMVLRDRKGPSTTPELRKTLRMLRITVEPFRPDDCAVAFTAFLRYGKGRHRARLNFGDCMAYAIAKTRRRKLLYKGDDFSHTDIEPAA